MTKQFVIHGVPTGKGRPRYANRGNFVTVYTPKKTAEYERYVQAEYAQQCNYRFERGLSLVVGIIAYYPIPKSTSKPKTLRMANKEVFPIVKPDLDNVAKIICDSLNDLAYHDDSQIVDLRVQKFYSLDPRVEVTIREAT